MSDPGQILQQEIQKAFPQFGSIRVLVNYQPRLNPSYDPDSGVTPNPSDPAAYDVRMIFGSISTNYAMQLVEITDEKVLAIDRSALVPALDMQTIPLTGDKLVDPDGVEWTVKAVKEDPAVATFKLWVRPRVA